MRSDSYGCRVWKGPEVLSSGSDVNSGQGPRLSFRIECKFEANLGALSSGLNVSSSEPRGSLLGVGCESIGIPSLLSAWETPSVVEMCRYPGEWPDSDHYNNRTHCSKNQINQPINRPINPIR